MSQIDHLELLQKIPLVRDNISAKYLESVANQINIFTCKKGQQFIIEGSRVNGLFFVCQGKAKVLKTGIYGREQILRFVGEGEIVGHRGFGVKEKYGISAVAIEDAVLCNFSSDILLKMLLEIPSLTYDLMLFYAEELNRSEVKIKALAQMTVREKVIDALLFIDRKFGRNPKGFFKIQLGRKEIADYSGTTVEQVIRVISALKKENLLVAQGKQIGVVNRELLKKEISEHNFFLDN